MKERNIATEVLNGLHEISEHLAGKRSLRTVHVEPRPRPDQAPDPTGASSTGRDGSKARSLHDPDSRAS